MKALVLPGWQQRPELRDVPVPEPGPSEALVAVSGAGACHSDLHLMEFPPGAMSFGPPFVLGHEITGVVAALGRAATGPEPGTAVAVYGPWGCGACATCRAGAENYCRVDPPGTPVGGLGTHGGMAEFMLVPAARHLVPLPGSLDPAGAAPLTDAGLTPFHAVERVRDRLVPGSTTVVIGAGGLGNLAFQILLASTATKVIAVDSRPEARALAQAKGADAALDSDADTAATIRDLTGGQGADAVLDVVGSDATLTMAAAVAAKDSHIVIVGIAGGSLPVSFLTLPYGIRVSTTYWGTRPDLHAVLALAARGDLVAETTTYPLSRAPEAYAALRAGKVTGRAVVVPDPAS